MVDPQKEGMRALSLHRVFLYSWSLLRVGCHLGPSARLEPLNLVFEVDEREGPEMSAMYKVKICHN